MGTVSVSIPDDLRSKMTHLEDINWSAVARKAFEEKINQIEFIEKLARKSKLTEKDAKVFSDKIKKAAAKRFLEMR